MSNKWKNKIKYEPVLSSREIWTDFPSWMTIRLSWPKSCEYPSLNDDVSRFSENPETNTTT